MWHISILGVGATPYELDEAAMHSSLSFCSNAWSCLKSRAFKKWRCCNGRSNGWKLLESQGMRTKKRMKCVASHPDLLVRCSE
jgi:hypothetical protein